jgi:PhnB protein
MTQLNAYIKFDGNCREAFEFYKDCLGGELALQTVGESPMAGQMPAQMHQSVLHASLTKGDLVLMGSDMIGSEGFVKGNSVFLCLVCSTKDEIQTFFSKLSAGGEVTHPLKEEFFGTFGDLTDQFGMNWMLQLDKPQA